MAAAYTRTLVIPASTSPVETHEKVLRRPCTTSSSYVNCSVPSSSSTARTSESSVQVSKAKEFRYSRASPSVRWPDFKPVESPQAPLTHVNADSAALAHVVKDAACLDKGKNFLDREPGIGEIDDGEQRVLDGQSSSPSRYSEAQELLSYLDQHATSSRQLVKESLVIVLCGAKQIDAALFQYREIREFGLRGSSSIMYDSLVKCCEDSELYADASQIFSDMLFYGLEPSEYLYQIMVHIYCKMGFPETAQKIIDEAEEKGIVFTNVDTYVGLINAYGRYKDLTRAEGLICRLRQRSRVVHLKVWNAFLQAYAINGYYEQARAAFNTMMRDGPAPTVDTMDALIGALIVDGRLDELYVVIQELQDMGFKIGKSSILLMLDAFLQARNVFEVKKLYHGMKAAGYFPTLDHYRAMVVLLARGKQVRDVTTIIAEMEEVGLIPDLVVWNSLLKMYTSIKDYRKAAEICKKIQISGLQVDHDTYNTLIILSCRDHRPEEGLRLMHEMRMLGMDPTLDAYKSLIAALCKQQLLYQAEDLFNLLRSKGYKLDRSFYHLMIKMYRNSGCYAKAEELLIVMKKSGLEPSAPTYLLMMPGGSRQPKDAEMLLDNMKSYGFAVGNLEYYTVIDAYLKNGDYNVGIQKLISMNEDGIEPDHRIWTCFIRAASLCECLSEALLLLKALQDADFDIPIRLLTVDSTSLILEVDCLLERLQALEESAAFNFVNALEDLLWAFELRHAASWVFQLALRRKIYRHDVFRVAEKDWGADFRKLSAGAALVGLTLWLDHMQDASLEGSPESSKLVALTTGAAEYNMVSVYSTLKAFLWEMGSPFYPCKARTGILVAKGHSLRMWLKDSPFCFDLELSNAPSLPKSNSMQLIKGCWMRCGLTSAFNNIVTRLGEVRPKKFARLALLSDEKRDQVIQADIEGRQEKLEKMKKRGVGLTVKTRRKAKLHGLRKFYMMKKAG